MENNNENEKIRDAFIKSIDYAENDFEKKITQISAGALALSITFIDKIVDILNAKYFFVLILGWVLLGICLSLNLFNALFSRKQNMNSLDEYNNIISTNRNLDDDYFNKVKKRNKLIVNIDYISLVTLLLGIFLIIVFSSLNISNQKTKVNMNKKEVIKEVKANKIAIIKENVTNQNK